MQETDQAPVQPEPKPSRIRPEPNPVTIAAHRRQVLWQITLPVTVVVALVLLAVVGVVLAGIRGSGETSLWADISVIWLIIPMLFLTIIFIVATAAMVYLLVQVLRNLPPYSRQMQDIMALVSRRVRQYSDAAVEPFLRWHSFSASVRSLRRKNLNRVTKERE